MAKAPQDNKKSTKPAARKTAAAKPTPTKAVKAKAPGAATGKAKAKPKAETAPKAAAKTPAAKTSTAKTRSPKPASAKTTASKPATKKPAAPKKIPAKKTAAKPRAKTTTAAKADVYRPWLNNYPSGISWDAPLDLTPVHERVLASCAQYPERDALDFLGAKTSFAELERQIRSFAAALQTDFGVKKGSRVALMLPNTPFYPVAYYAVLMCGGTVVNCNPLYSTKELGHIVGNSGADILVTLDLTSIFSKAETLLASGAIKSIIVWHFPNALPLVKKLLFSTFKRKDLTNWQQGDVAKSCHAAADLLTSNAQFTPVAVDPQRDVAVQQYTGGTTGVPKGAMLSHANISANVSQVEIWGDGLFTDPTKLIAVLPFFHIFAMTVCLNVPLASGLEVVMLPKFDLKSFLNLVSRTRANVLPAVPTLTHAIATGDGTTPEQIKSLEVIISGGAALPNEVRAEFKAVSDALLAEGYGLTETSPVACCAPLRMPSKNMSIGQPLPGTDIRFADLEDPTKIVAPGERGEVQIKGPQVMLGYYENKTATNAAIRDGWFGTGDVGYIDDEGFVFLVDRIKDLIICSGFNVYPRAIEEAIYEHPSVDECNVIGAPDKYRGEAPIAFVKLRSGKRLTEDELQTFLKAHISKIEMPREIIFKDQLPKTLVGKLSKKELREEYEAKNKGNERT